MELSAAGPRARALAPRLLLAGATAAVLALGTPSVAFAAPGDNGDVKVHDSATAPDSQNNDPKVCQFHLAAFNFDTIELVTWTIEQQPPTGNATVLGGAIVLATGTGATGTYALPDGHYKLLWTFAGQNGEAKQKVFTVECAPSTPTATPTATSSPSFPIGIPSPSASPSHHGYPVGGVDTGGGGTSGPDTAEVIGGATLLAAAAAFGVRTLRRRAARDGES
ncbi:hypothetical protein ACWGB8_37435 [Kitasatospora sp. NPDC054939]